MPKGRANMMKVAEMLFSTLRELHERVLQQAVARLQREGLAEGAAEETEEIECALLAFKTLRYLLIYGFGDPSANETAKAFFISTVPMFSSLLSLRLSLLSSAPSSRATPRLVLLTKHVVSYGKLYRALLAYNPIFFSAMGVSLQIIEAYWQAVQGASSKVVQNVADDPLALYPERLVVQSLLLLKSTTGDWDGSSGLDISLDFVRQLAELLVTRLLPLRQDDLEKWDADPEEWMNEEEMERWEFELRPCAEFVLKALLSAYRDELGPSMAALLQQVSTPQSMEGLLLKEAVYTAVGRSPSDLESAINFQGWLEGTLVAECYGTDSNYRIIRRRIAWLLGNWVGEDLAASSRTQIYTLLVHLLGRNASTDPAIRLTAARSLAKCDTWDFDREAFVPLLPKAIQEVVQLLGEVSMSDSMMRLNQTLGVVIDRVGAHVLRFEKVLTHLLGGQIAPYAPQLAEILATLWAGAHENHFQTSLLVTLTKLAEALDDQSQALHPQACPIIQLSVDPSAPSHIYLQEDGLELWQVLLRRSTSLSLEMRGLLPLLISLLSYGTDVLPRCLAIFESYLLLDAAGVISVCSTNFFTAIQDLLDGLKLEAVKVVLHTLNTVFQAAPASVWAGALDSSGCFARFLTSVSQPVGYLRSDHHKIPDTFHQLVQATATRTGSSADEILGVVVNQFIERVDNFSQGGQRKLIALALAYLVPTTSAVILSRLPDLVSVWSGVLAQTEETQEGDAELYHIPDDYQSDIEVDYTETLETTRRQELGARDPIRTHKLASFIGQKLAEAQTLNGGPDAFQQRWLAQVDPLLVEELVKRLDGRLAG
ncbi:SPOSA6832_00361, partial [Sporobolomyces salmonicolor]